MAGAGPGYQLPRLDFLLLLLLRHYWCHLLLALDVHGKARIFICHSLYASLESGRKSGKLHLHSRLVGCPVGEECENRAKATFIGYHRVMAMPTASDSFQFASFLLALPGFLTCRTVACPGRKPCSAAAAAAVVCATYMCIYLYARMCMRVVCCCVCVCIHSITGNVLRVSPFALRQNVSILQCDLRCICF